MDPHRVPPRGFEDRLFVGAVLLSTLPSVLIILLFKGGPAFGPASYLLFFLGFALMVFGFRRMRRRILQRWLNVANLLGSLRERDFSVRGHARGSRDGPDLVLSEFNLLADMLYELRLQHTETHLLLEKVFANIQHPVLLFDEEHTCVLLNAAARGLWEGPFPDPLGRSARELVLEDWLTTPPEAIVSRRFPGREGRWRVHVAGFRQSGYPRKSMVLSNLSQDLRAQEREGFHNLVRVLGHELNNSLAPIQSMTDTLQTLIARDPLPDDFRQDAAKALSAISKRTDSLRRFMQAYSRLRRLPPPSTKPVPIAALMKSVVDLYNQPRVSLSPGPELMARLDPGQLELVLTNLLKNAVEASDQGEVSMGWVQEGESLLIWIRDQGPGLTGGENLFVPFFTTKSGGTGLGLVLSRQIIEAHGGTLFLRNREERGAEAEIRLPLKQ